MNSPTHSSCPQEILHPFGRDLAATEGRGKSVLFVTNTPAIFGGTEKHLLDLIERLQPLSVKTAIFCADQDPFSSRLNSGEYQTQVIRPKHPPRRLSTWIRLFQRVKPDVVVFVHSVLSSFYCGPYLAARLSGAKIYAIQHLIPAPPLPKADVTSLGGLMRRIAGYRTRNFFSLRILESLSQATICVSQAVCNGLVQLHGFHPDKTKVILNGVKASDFQPSAQSRQKTRDRLGVRETDILLVMVARLSAQKGIDIFLEAAHRLRQEAFSFRCVIVGDGPLRESIENQIRELGLYDHVHLAGFQKDVQPYLQAADLFVMSSYREGLPLSLLEAMASGLPSVVTNVGGNAEAVTHQQEGLVVNPGSPDELVSAIGYLLSHPEDRRRMSLLARERVCRVFDLDVQMHTIIRTIVG